MLQVLRFSLRYSASCRSILSKRSQISRNHNELVANFHKCTLFHSNDDSHSKNQDKLEIAPNIASKYKVFTDDKAEIILDMEEEREKMLRGELEIEEVDSSPLDIYASLNTKRRYKHMKLMICMTISERDSVIFRWNDWRF